MKKLILVIAFLLFCTTAHATLIDNLDGTISDDDFDIMWLANVNLPLTESFGVSGINSIGQMNWDTANEWINGMNTSNYLGYSDWRLPSSLNKNAPFGPDTYGPVWGTNFQPVNTSEMGHLFYNELSGYTLPFALGITSTSDPDIALFQNFTDNFYWSGTINEDDSTKNTVWGLSFGNGAQVPTGKTNHPFVMAVRDITPEPIPEPSTWILLGIGMIGIVFISVRKKLSVNKCKA